MPAEEPKAASGKQQNASRASVDRASIERPRERGELWQVPIMARKVRGKRGATCANRIHRRFSSGWVRVRSGAPPLCRLGGVAGRRCPDPARHGIASDAGETRLLGSRPDRWSVPAVCNVIPLVRLSRAERGRGRPGPGLPWLLPSRVPDRPNRQPAPPFRGGPGIFLGIGRAAGPGDPPLAGLFGGGGLFPAPPATRLPAR